MNNRLSHTAKKSYLTTLWHLVRPLMPNKLKFSIRNRLQYVHSRHLSKNDVLLLSYPKSGSTWLRSMLLMSLSENTVKASELAKWLPPLHMANEPKLSEPRVVRSHDMISTPGFSKASKILVLIRDPRAVAVSYHHHQLRRGRYSTVESSAHSLLSEGYDNIGSWQLHVRRALQAANRANVKVITYEELTTNTASTFASVLDFYGISISKEKRDYIIQESTPEKLRLKRALTGVEGSSKGQSDIRKASADSWKTECPLHCQELIESSTDSELIALGYELSALSSVEQHTSSVKAVNK